jgi:hypothetical protein
MYREYRREPGLDLLARFSYAATFDTERGDAAGTLTADAQQLSSWSVRAELYNDRDPRAKRYKALWAARASLVDQNSTAREDLRNALAKWPAYVEWQTRAIDRVVNEVEKPMPSPRSAQSIREAAERFRAVLAEELPALDALAERPESVSAAMDAHVAALRPLLEAREAIYEHALKGLLATIDWTTERAPDAPDLYTVTGILETSLGAARRSDLALNGTFAFYGDAPAGSTRRFKQFSVTGQFDRPLGRVINIPFVFTLAGRYEYIPDDIPVSASAATGAMSPELAPGASGAEAESLATALKGHIGVLQAKLTIPLKGTGARIPISVTAANRTELVEEKTVRANFGVTFDLDAFVAAVKAR